MTRPLVVYVIGIHVARAESRIFVTSALSQVHSEAQSCIKGYHIYKAVWTPYIMPCSRELTNGHDPFAVKVSQLHGEEERIVGHLPRKSSSMCSIFFEMWKTPHPLISK